MGVPADTWVPAVSALGGALIGGSVTITVQCLTNRGATNREREARRDAFMVRRYEIERDTLLALQDALMAHMQLWLHLAAAHPRDGDQVNEQDLISSAFKISALASRLINRDAATSATKCCEIAQSALERPHEHRDEAANVCARAHRVIGNALRADPFAM